VIIASSELPTAADPCQYRSTCLTVAPAGTSTLKTPGWECIPAPFAMIACPLNRD